MTCKTFRAAVLAVACTGIVPPMGQADPTPTTGSVVWTDGSGASGTLPFQGVIDGATVTGALNAPTVELRVAGTVASGGTASGTITTTSGQSVGTFTATHDGTVLVGSFTVDAGSPVNFAALSDQLPPP